MAVALRGRGWTLFRGACWGRTHVCVSHTCMHAPGTVLRHFVIPGMCRGGGGLLMSLRVQAFPLKPLLNTRAQTRAHTHAQRFPRHTHVHGPLCRDTEAQKHTHPLTPRLSFLAPEQLFSPAGPSAPARPPALSPSSLSQRANLFPPPRPVPSFHHVYLNRLL